MFKQVGAENNRQVVILAAVILLVAVSPLGKEATHPFVFFAYRTLLFTIALLCAAEIYQRRETEVCPGFLAACGAVLLLMWLSYHINTGSRFDGSYLWYQHVLFGAAFVAFAALNRSQPHRWKQVILGAVVAIDVMYLLVDLILGRRPVNGTFVNPNYFASYLTVGFGIAAAVALFSKNLRTRFGSAVIAAFLFYGLTQAWSRGAVLTAVAVTGLAFLRLNKRTALKLSAVGALVLSGILALSPGLTKKFLARGEENPYNYMRPTVWMATMEMIGQYPILGVGLGQFDPVSIRFAPPVEGTIGRYMKRIGIAHSQYLQYAAELGIPGAALFFGLAGYVVVICIQRARSRVDDPRIFQEAAILTAAGLGIHALVDNNWSVPVIAAGLVVFALGDVLPARPWNLRFDMTRSRLAMIVMAAAGIYFQSTFIPALGLYFNEEGHKAFVAGDLDRAESLHRMAAGIIPESPVFLENVGLVYMDRYSQTRRKRYLDDARIFFSRAIAADPNAPRFRRHMESVFIQQLTGDVAKDQSIHQKIIDVDRQVLERDPVNPFVRRNLAEALYHSGARQEAERELTKAIELEPNYVSAHLRLADWKKETGDLSESENQRNKAMSIVEKYRHVTRPEPYEALLLGRPISEPNGTQK